MDGFRCVMGCDRWKWDNREKMRDNEVLCI